MKTKRFAAAGILLIFVITFLTSFYDVFYSFDSLLRDKLYQMPRGINNKIKIISIDDETLQKIGPFGTWSRSVYADVINALGDYPSVVTLDIMVFGDMDNEGDDALRQACLEHSNVIAGSYITYDSVIKTDENNKAYIDNFHIRSVEEPIISGCTATGFVNATADDDGIVRSAFISENYDGKTIYSLAAQSYFLYCEKNGTAPVKPKLDSNNRMWINYAGRPYDYEHISLSSVLDGTVDPRIFNGCIVLVGAYTSGLQDQFSVPNSSDQMFEVEIHANIIQSLIDEKTSVPANKLITSLLSAVITAAAFFLFGRLKIKASTPIMAALILAYGAVGIVLNMNGSIIPLLYAPLFILIGYLTNLGWKYAEAAIEKHKITAAFKKYVAPQVVEEISKSGSYHIKLGGENRHIAVLFVDIRGFTPMSESLEPEQVVDILNSYLNLTTNAIFNNGGTLDKFIGDATMAVFNAPFDLDDYIFRAVKTAVDIVDGGNAIESKFLEKYGKSVSFGVGVNCGNAVVGNIGCDFRMDYTAIGDTVNTAARLESNAKRGQVLISEAVYNEVKDRINAEPIGEIPLKGKSKGVFVYSVTGIK